MRSKEGGANKSTTDNSQAVPIKDASKIIFKNKDINKQIDEIKAQNASINKATVSEQFDDHQPSKEVEFRNMKYLEEKFEKGKTGVVSMHLKIDHVWNFLDCDG